MHADQPRNPESTDRATLAQRATALWKAVGEGHTTDVHRLLALDHNLVHAADENNKTLLHWAAEQNQPQAARQLLEAGATIESQTNWGMTPLEWAANMGSRQAAEVLLERGARLNLWAAAGLGRLDDVRFWFTPDGTLRAGAGQTRHRTTAAGTWESVPAPTDRNPIVSDAFYIACRNGHTHVAEFLHSQGADVNQRGFFGAPGLHWACINGHAETVQFLLRNGADVTLCDTQFQGDPINWALEREQFAMVDLLLAHGMRMTLSQACVAGNREAVLRLLEAVPDQVNTSDRWGTPLHQAVTWGRADVVRLLLQRGADPTIPNCHGETARDLARRGLEGAFQPANPDGRRAIWEALGDKS